MIKVRNVNWGGYYPGGRRSILAHSEGVQSDENKIYSTDDVADSNVSVNDNNSNTSYSDDEGDDHLYSNVEILASFMTATATTVTTATRASIETPVIWQYSLRTVAVLSGKLRVTYWLLTEEERRKWS